MPRHKKVQSRQNLAEKYFEIVPLQKELRTAPERERHTRSSDSSLHQTHLQGQPVQEQSPSRKYAQDIGAALRIKQWVGVQPVCDQGQEGEGPRAQRQGIASDKLENALQPTIVARLQHHA